MDRRFLEIDALRGIAIIFMILYHIFYDLYYFAGLDIDLWSGPLWFIGRASAATFIFLVGVSLTISFSRAKTGLTEKEMFRKYLYRGTRIFSWGLLITAMTYLFLNKGTIYFGILHFIGLSIILAYPFLKLKKQNISLAAVIITIGLYLKDLAFNTALLIPLGIKPVSFYTLDYFPLFPWFGAMLIGIYIGNTFYPKGKRMIKMPNLKRQLKPLAYLGKNSLMIYLIHQPIVIAVIYIASIVLV